MVKKNGKGAARALINSATETRTADLFIDYQGHPSYYPNYRQFRILPIPVRQ